MHTRRTSKLARATRKKGGLRKKRTSMAEEETTKEKESMGRPATLAEEEAHAPKKGRREGVRHTRPKRRS